MIVKELREKLTAYPSSSEVILEVMGEEYMPTDVDWRVDGGEVVAVITDYPTEET